MKIKNNESDRGRFAKKGGGDGGSQIRLKESDAAGRKKEDDDCFRNKTEDEHCV